MGNLTELKSAIAGVLAERFDRHAVANPGHAAEAIVAALFTPTECGGEAPPVAPRFELKPAPDLKAGV